MEIKRCAKCKEYKALSTFEKRKHKPKKGGKSYLQPHPYCKPCMKLIKRNEYLKRTYGITLEIYEELNERQNKTCAICDSFCSTGKVLAVDHCHKTGKVRGLLCMTCNRAVGLLKDNSNLFLKGFNYLKVKV